MLTVTAHTVFSRAAKYSAGATSLGCAKPAVVSLPFAFARKSGKKTARSVCCYADPKSPEHPSNISPFALVHPKPTTTAFWKIKEDAMKVELTFFKMPEDAKPEDFQVAIQGDVLVIRKPSDDQPQPTPTPDGILFHVRLHVPELYDKANIKAELEPGNLVVTIPRLPKPDSVKELFYKKVTVEKEGTPTVEKEGTPKV